MPADNCDGAARSDDPRTGQDAFLRCTAKRLHDLIAPRAQIAHRGKTCLSRQVRVLCTDQRVPFRRLRCGAPEFPAGIARKMGVKVDKPGDESLALEVDHFCAFGHRLPAVHHANDPAI